MDITDNLGLIYAESLADVIATTTGIRLLTDYVEDDNFFEDITGVMILKGKENGILSVSAKTSDVRILCSAITGVPEADVTEDDLDDTMCELVNMTAGSAKLRISGTKYMFSLTQPFVIKGKDMSIVTKSITNVISGTLSNGEISVKIKAVY